MKETDVLVIGAGPSGSVAAAELLQEGFDVTVVEKTKFPRFVIGESLLPRCMEILDAVDLVETVRKAGFQQKYGAKFLWEDRECDFNFSEQFTTGWSWTWQVPRADFDKVLIDEVEKRGAHCMYETTVKDVKFLEDHVETTVSCDGTEEIIKSKYIIDGSGYGRVLPRLLELDRPSSFPPRASIFSHIKDTDRPDNESSDRIQIFLVKDEIWVWVIPFSNGYTSVGVVGEFTNEQGELADEEFLRKILSNLSGIADRFADKPFVFDPKKITAYSATVSEFCGDRFVLTGNSTEFLDPVFSSGVTFALESAYRAAQLVGKELRGESANWQDDYVHYIQSGVDVFRSYVIGWYDGTLPTIFFSSVLDQNIKNQICSVLAGYVWDQDNPYVRKHDKVLTTLAKVIKYNLS